MESSLSKPDLLTNITSNKTALYLTLSAVVVLFPNVFYVFYKVAGDMPIPGLQMAQALLVAVYISWSIVYFTLKGDTRTAVGFATFEMFISFFYYWLRLMYEHGHFEWNWYIIPAIAFAVFLPWSVKNYAGSIIKPALASEKSVDYEYKTGQDEINTELAWSRMYPDYNTVPEHHYNTVPEQRADKIIMVDGMKYNVSETEEIFRHNKREFEKTVQLNIDQEKEIAHLQEENEKLKSTLVHPDTFKRIDDFTEELKQIDWKHAGEIQRLEKEKNWYKDLLLKYADKITPEEARKLNQSDGVSPVQIASDIEKQIENRIPKLSSTILDAPDA